MLFLPPDNQIGLAGQAAHDAVYVVLGDRLQDDPPKLIFEKLHPRASRDPVFPPQLGRNHKLAF